MLDFEQILERHRQFLHKLARMYYFPPSPVLGYDDALAGAQACLYEVWQQHGAVSPADLEALCAAWVRNKIGKLKLRELHRGEHAKLTLSLGDASLDKRCTTTLDARLEEVYYQEYVRIISDMLPLTAQQVFWALISPDLDALALREAEFEARARGGVKAHRLRRIPLKRAYVKAALRLSSRSFSKALVTIKKVALEVLSNGQ